ncbi:ANTAR domain-containing protein [uncultured Pseudokineococcus sp.]|uniref:ANTAR domain-containing protein n=1 Tax=uncultured Pseudokineococcus sp. TaxID=1642928 RepID=UPI0026137F50|nr:hypothetical protein [uncultured Pseudokineococcus sp.]
MSTSGPPGHDPLRAPRGSTALRPPAEMELARQLATEAGADRVSLALFAGPHDRAVVHGSDPVLVALDDMDETVGQGPTHELLATAAPVTVEDLHADDDRWPLLSATFAVPPELRGLLLLPLRGTGPGAGGRVDVFGALVLARDRCGPFPLSGTTTALGAATLLATMVMVRALHEDPDTGDDSLDDLIDPRVDVVTRAVGVLGSSHDLPHGEARRHLQALAFTTGRTLHQTAARLLRDEA